MVVLCNANIIIEYDGGRSELSSAPLDVEYDNNSIEHNLNSKDEHVNPLPLPLTITYPSSVVRPEGDRRVLLNS